MKNIGLYLDVKEILDQSLASGGGRLDFLTTGAAIHWRHRAYQFRKLYRTGLGEAISPYDRLTIPAVAAGQLFVLIERKETKATFTPSGLAPIASPQPVEDELDSFALDFAKSLDLS